MKIQVELKTNYGNQAIYPACDTSKIFAAMVGAKTLTPATIKHIKELGYFVEVINPVTSL